MNSKTLNKIEGRSRRSESGSTRKAIFLRNSVIKIPDRGEKTTQSIGDKVLAYAAKGLRLNDLVDNCSNNGDKLKDSIIKIANEWVKKGFADNGFIEYLEDNKKAANQTNKKYKEGSIGAKANILLNYDNKDNKEK